MKTDELIRALTADGTVAPRASRMLPLSLGIGLAISALIFVVALGPRPDIAQAAESVRFLFKPFLMLVLASTAWMVLSRLIEPGAPARTWTLAIIPAVLVLALAAELMSVPRGQWERAMIGDNWYLCLALIPLLSFAPAVALLLALRHGAATHPAAAGAIAGLVASGLGAALYAVNCTDDSPLFVAVWYSLAIGLVCLISAYAGGRLLRW
jgi:hypothetical protein